MRINIKKTILFVVVLLNSQLFFAITVNPFGIKYLHEVYLLALILFSCVYVYHQSDNNRLSRFDLFIFLLVIYAALLSVILSYLNYSQPLIYGVIESRRIFSLYIYFPLVYAIRKRYVNHRELLNIVLLVTFVCTAFGWVAHIVNLPVSADPGGEDSLLRHGRYTIGSFYVYMSIAILLLSGASHYYKYRYVLTLYLLLYTVYVLQTRQLYLIIAATVLYYLYTERKKISSSMLVVGLAGVFAIGGSSYFNYISDKMLLGEERLGHLTTLDASARGRTIAHGFAALADNYFVGLGGVSKLWDGGFTQIFHENFYLVDVGWLGTIIRYGVFSLIIVHVYIVLLYAMRKRRNVSSECHVAYLYTVILLLIFPLASTMDYYGYVVGVGFAIAFSSKKAV